VTADATKGFLNSTVLSVASFQSKLRDGQSSQVRRKPQAAATQPNKSRWKISGKI
jgi:hypothetical protein